MLFSFVFNSEINELTNHKNHVFIFISFQGSLCNQEKLECIKQVEVDHSNCIKPCSGLVVTSFSKSAIEENIEHLYPISSAHENYKKITESPSGFKGILLFWFLKWFYWILIFKDFEWKNNLRFVRIYFDLQHLTELLMTEQQLLLTCCQQLEAPWDFLQDFLSSVEWRFCIL